MLTFTSILIVVLGSLFDTTQPWPLDVRSDTNVTNCSFTSFNATAILQAQTLCDEILFDGIEVPAGETLDLSQLKTGANVLFKGRITWGYVEWTGPLIRVIGSNIRISGLPGHVLDGRGALWWDGIGGNGGKDKPIFLNAVVQNSEIQDLYIINSPVHVVDIRDSNGLLVENVIIDDSAGDYEGGGHNTDGFDVENCTDVIIRHTEVYNQDDCFAFRSGRNVTFSDSYCYGGHGVSIGSVGARPTNDVELVYINNIQIVDSENGIRIKTVYNATGSVTNVTFEDIILSNIQEYGIVIRSDYKNEGPTGEPTDGVPITNIAIRNVTGTVLPSGSNVYFLVLNASDWSFSNVNITGGERPVECKGIPPGADISC